MKPWLHLARISNLPTVWTNVTAAWLLAGGVLADPRLYWLILAGSLLYTGGMILNDAADVKFDREHRKERPIPSGQVSIKAAWSVGMAMMVLGSALAIFFEASVWITLALVASIMFYDLYHKPWAGSVVVMGACRTLLYLTAASAVEKVVITKHNVALFFFGAELCFETDWLPLSFWLVLPYALALGCYVVGITIGARLERKHGSLSMMRSLLTFGILYVPGLLFLTVFFRSVGGLGQVVVVLTFTILVGVGCQTLRQGGAAVGRAVGLLLAGIAVVDALAVSTVSVPLALCFVALAPLLRLWQRWVAAT
ncbi:MAG TPA: hypothetical protein DDZ88_30615 [Verrucomicrobiales bacterium]|nr:hypothetical protein [Verrucomicrobiales bacterium]